MFITNSQYVLRENSELRVLAKLSDLGIRTWHARMRHLRYDNLIKLQNQIDELNLMSESKSNEICESCMIDRQKRNVNKTSRISAIKFLEIVHTDLSESLSRIRSEHAYYMTFRDDWSDVIWVHLLRNKNQAFEAFKNFQVNIERSADDCKIITLRKNNASEYIDQKFQDYLIEQRINWDPRASYVPEQNGEAERLNRTLMYKIRSMLNDRKISKRMWDEIIKTAAYLSNRSSHYQHKISYEMIKSKKSDLSHLCIIESTAWVHILKKKIKKLDDRSWKNILVNYEDENQYRICDSRTDKIHIVRDVKFDEITSRRYQFDENDSSDDEFWTHEDDKLLDSNFEIENSSISSKWRTKLKTVDNRVGSSDLNERNLNSVRAVDLTNDLTNALDQMMKNLNLDAENHLEINHFEIFSENFSADDQDNQTNEKIQPQVSRRSDRERKASKLAERIIQYDLRKKMSRANVVVEDKFAYKKILKCYTHMIKVLITLINSDDQSNSTDQSDESQTLIEAMQRSDWSKWEKTMRAEFNSLVENQIWNLTKRSDDKNVIIERWIFRLKRDRDDNSLRYKVRWMTHDFKQRHEVDFDETFASVVKLISYKTLMTISIIRELQIRHMNVVIAFLYELLDEDVYVIQSHMFEFEKNEDLVCKLKRALYDLKQTSKMWYDIIHKFLIDLEFKRSSFDHSVFIKDEIFLIMYVDDLLLFDLNLNDLRDIQNQLKQRFKMTNLRQLFHYLKMKIIISSDQN